MNLDSDEQRSTELQLTILSDWTHRSRAVLAPLVGWGELRHFALEPLLPFWPAVHFCPAKLQTELSPQISHACFKIRGEARFARAASKSCLRCVRELSSRHGEPVATGSSTSAATPFTATHFRQHHSTAPEFPVVLIGGKNLGLSTGGRTIVYPGVDSGGSGHRQVSNVWNTLGHLAGEQLDTFGAEGPFRVATGPLHELMA